jgi:uncharacterized membrane protein
MMPWTERTLAQLPMKDDVRLRGMDMTRLETFCDAAFAFAVTLLVISRGTIPTSFAELLDALKEIPAFLFSFSIILSLWIAHRRWSRRYGLEDGWTTLISLAMVFVMLVYVYPLRMLASAFMSFLTAGWLPSSLVFQSARDLTGLFVVYGLGFAIQTALLALLYLRAIRARDELGLNGLELLRTRQEVTIHAVLAASGVASALIAAFLPPSLGKWAGFVYATLPIIMPILGVRHSRQADALREA